jgi:hypothetical protein
MAAVSLVPTLGRKQETALVHHSIGSVNVLKSVAARSTVVLFRNQSSSRLWPLQQLINKINNLH